MGGSHLATGEMEAAAECALSDDVTDAIATGLTNFSQQPGYLGPFS